MTEPEFWEQPHIKRWAEHVINDMVPKMQASQASVTLYTGSVDLKLMVETGAAVLLGKPIIVVAVGDSKLPRKLRQVADEIVECPDGIDADASLMLQEALLRIRGRGLL